ncbi:MAG: nicotinate phosphoribosyltransferase [Anaerolineales bacterium]|nr:nicotinate phosphoribosyltransferase [Anaerolineales bacterium]
MDAIKKTYRDSLALLTDFYEITMAYGYWKAGMADREAVFHVSFRQNPFNGGYTIACGLAHTMEYLENFGFDDSDLDYLAGIPDRTGKPLLEKEFLRYLGNLRLRCDVDAVPEGTVMFPQEPMLRIRGPLLECQLLETVLLNILNFQSLIATKAARVSFAAEGAPVLEFGLRRAQGFDGGLAASRAAYIGGCSATSNVLAGKLFGIPVAGTHSHSWVMAFPTEREAFEEYARIMPDNCIFLVDTYQTLQGVRIAAETANGLRARGSEMTGIRLDSGDLAALSVESRRILDEAGFPDAKIVASNEMDEYIIESLKHQGAKIDLWGVGTKLVTAFDQPALGGVYKLSALMGDDGEWEYKMKVSDHGVKTSTPGFLQVRRFRRGGMNIADAILEDGARPAGDCIIVDTSDPAHKETVAADAEHEDLLIPVMRGGKTVYPTPPLEEIRRATVDNLAHFPPAIKRFIYPHLYPVGLEIGLYRKKITLALKNAKRKPDEGEPSPPSSPV